MKSKTIKLYNCGIEDHYLPVIPNFIRRVYDDFPVLYGELSDAQVRKVGRAFTEALVEKAKQQRKNRTEFHLPARPGRGEQ